MVNSKQVHVRYAESLSEIYQQIEDIADEIHKEEKERPLLWFRGHARAAYNLYPSICRGAKSQYNRNKTYSSEHLREEYRFQSFMARNYDNLNYRMPQSVIEWQEVMQHYFIKTRLMDWSESLTVALEFALEDFIKPVRDLEVQEKCRTSDPAIWILRPDRLNRIIYDSFCDNLQNITRAVQIHNGNTALALKVQQELRRERESGIYYELKKGEEKNMNVMVSLSSLEMLRNTYKGREPEALASAEMNPFFYLLLRYYSDGLPVEYGTLPPLAIVHPYHSERIRVQRGVFTVFPHYLPNQQMKEINLVLGEMPTIAMEYMGQCVPYLYKIQILDPYRVAEDIMMAGARRGNIYPDIQIISQDMENVVALQYH